MRAPSIRYESTAARKSSENRQKSLKRSMTFAHAHNNHHNKEKDVGNKSNQENSGTNESGKFNIQTPLRHSNSRISEIIRQYNQSQQYQTSNNGFGAFPEPLIAPPAAFPNTTTDNSLASSNNELSLVPDEDWLLQKTLERKRRQKKYLVC